MKLHRRLVHQKAVVDGERRRRPHSSSPTIVSGVVVIDRAAVLPDELDPLANYRQRALKRVARLLGESCRMVKAPVFVQTWRSSRRI